MFRNILLDNILISMFSPAEIVKSSTENIAEGLEEFLVLDTSNAENLSQKKMKSTEWAEIIDVSSSVPNFKELVPNPAFTWPFELDNFQKHV